MSNVQRDYVFGWLIGGLFEVSALRDVVALKGGNALRKAYFPATRFSDDIDFTTRQGLDPDALLRELNEVCRFAEARTGVKFDVQRNQVVGEQLIERGKRIYKLRLYFRDFSGNADHIPLKVKVDVTEFDRIHLPVETRRLIHQYSDAGDCGFDIRVVKLEEALADKTKCLIQRRYTYDLFDLVYDVFVNRELEVDRSELVQTFLRKTIFERSPSPRAISCSASRLTSSAASGGRSSARRRASSRSSRPCRCCAMGSSLCSPPSPGARISPELAVRSVTDARSRA